MPLDQRKIQTAVIGAPDSSEPAYMPQDTDEALTFRDQTHHLGHTHWCGRLLGGCGQRLSVKIVLARRTVPHFAHLAGAGHCGRGNLGNSSADHLYAHRGLSAWLRAQGQTSAEPTYQGELDHGRACTQMVLPNPVPGQKAWRLVFDAASDLDLLALASSRQAHRNQWLLLDPTHEDRDDRNARLRQVLIKHGVRIQRFRLRTEGAARVMDIGEVEPTSGELLWSPLAEHTLTAGVVKRPGADQKSVPSPALVPAPRVRAPATPKPSVVDQTMDALEHCLARQERAEVRAHAQRLKQFMDHHELSGKVHSRARALRERAGALLAQDAAVAVHRPRSRPAAPPRGEQVRRQEREHRRERAEQVRREEQGRRSRAAQTLAKLDSAWQDQNLLAYVDAFQELELTVAKARTPADVRNRIRAKLAEAPRVERGGAIEHEHRWWRMNTDSLIRRLRRCEESGDRRTHAGVLGELRTLRFRSGVPADVADRIDAELERARTS